MTTERLNRSIDLLDKFARVSRIIMVIAGVVQSAIGLFPGQDQSFKCGMFLLVTLCAFTVMDIARKVKA